MSERAYMIAEGGGPLAAVLYRPPAQARGTLVFCHPLFEERKSAHRAMVETARTLCERGYAVLRFDYRGCGDSAGAFEDYSLSDWAADTRRALEFARWHVPGACPGLLALRLGAAPALLAAAGAGVDFAILWEPVLKGAEHLEQELRKKLMKEMLTFGRSRGTRAELLKRLEGGESIDFDGYAVSPRLYRDLRAFDALAAGPPGAGYSQEGGPGAPRAGGNTTGAGHEPCPCAERPGHQGYHPGAALAVQVSPQEQSGAAAQWVAGLKTSGCGAECRHVALPPFWNLIGHVDIAPLAEATLTWMERSPRGGTA